MEGWRGMYVYSAIKYYLHLVFLSKIFHTYCGSSCPSICPFSFTTVMSTTLVDEADKFRKSFLWSSFENWSLTWNVFSSSASTKLSGCLSCSMLRCASVRIEVRIKTVGCSYTFCFCFVIILMVFSLRVDSARLKSFIIVRTNVCVCTDAFHLQKQRR